MNKQAQVLEYTTLILDLQADLAVIENEIEFLQSRVMFALKQSVGGVYKLDQLKLKKQNIEKSIEQVKTDLMTQIKGL